MRQRLRILLVEDEPNDAQMIRAALREARSSGFIVMHETTLAGALDRLSVSSSFDALLMDLSLPDSDSTETLPRMMAAKPNLPIVVMTDLDDPLVAEQAIEMGAQDYLVKDEIDTRSLARTLRNAIHRFRSEKERLALADTLAAEYDRMAEELALARDMQFDLLPRPNKLERVRASLGLAVEGYFKPSSDIGGDLWGCLEGDSGCLVLYALDFSGHGVGAALNVFRLHTLISELSGQISDPAAILRQINTALHALLPRGQYATMVLAVIDAAAAKLTWSGAGAPRPLLFTPDGQARWLDTAGIPLGLSSSAKYFNRETELPMGASLFVYSDAITEAEMEDGSMFEDDRLQDLVRAHYRPGEGIVIPALASQFLESVITPLADDMTAVSVTRLGSAS